jgi:hypothetical protein
MKRYRVVEVVGVPKRSQSTLVFAYMEKLISPQPIIGAVNPLSEQLTEYSDVQVPVLNPAPVIIDEESML